MCLLISTVNPLHVFVCVCLLFMLPLVHSVNFAQVSFAQQGSLQDFASQVEPWPLVFRCSFPQFSGANRQAGRERSCTCWFTWWCLAPSACRHVIYLISISVSLFTNFISIANLLFMKHMAMDNQWIYVEILWNSQAHGGFEILKLSSLVWDTPGPPTCVLCVLQVLALIPKSEGAHSICVHCAAKASGLAVQAPRVPNVKKWPPRCGECSVDLISCVRSGDENQACVRIKSHTSHTRNSCWVERYTVHMSLMLGRTALNLWYARFPHLGLAWLLYVSHSLAKILVPQRWSPKWPAQVCTESTNLWRGKCP